MPIAADPNVIFIHTPKTGGTSILTALRGSGMELAFDDVGLWDRLREHPRGAGVVRALKMIYPVNVIASFAEKHLPAAVLRELVPAEVWERSFKFAFVRNPWDLVVSTFFYIRANEAWFESHEPDYARVACGGFQDFVRFYPMIAGDTLSMIADEAGEVIVDFVGRYERLEDDFAAVCRRLGISAELPHLNRSEHESYREYYDAATRSIVERHFARDIERFGYSF